MCIQTIHIAEAEFMAGNPIQRLRIPSVRTAPEVSTVEPIDLPSASPLNTAEAALTDLSAPDSVEIELESIEAGQPQEKNTPSKTAPKPAKPSPSKLSARLWRGVRLVGVPLTWLTLIGLCGGTGVAAFWWLTTLPPVPDCKNPQPFSGDADRLSCAEQAARSGDVEALLKGLELVKTWGADHPLAPQVKKLTQEWSKALLNIARSRAEQNNLEGAIALAQKLSSGNPLYKEAQAAIATWKQNRGQGKNYDSAIDAALKAQNWAEVDAQLQAIARLNGDYWRQYASRQRQRAIGERTARRQLEQVRGSI